MIGLAVVALLAGCGGSKSSTTATVTGGPGAYATAAEPPPEPTRPTAAGLNACVNTLFTKLGAPPEHGGELEPAFVVRSGPGHRPPSLLRTSKLAGAGVLIAQANQVEAESSPVELYFFNSAKAAIRALAAARREAAHTLEQSSEARVGIAGAVIYLETGPVASKSVDAISECLRQAGGEPISD
jgi:hypothetical protein